MTEPQVTLGRFKKGTSLNVGLVGATGLVGAMMRQILAERSFPVGQLRFFASARSAGTEVTWQDMKVTVEDVSGASFDGLDVVLLSAGAGVSKQFAPLVASAGAIAIDNSSAWRNDRDVPLIVSEVNPDALAACVKGIVANPNCTTMVAMPAIKPLADSAGLRRIVASTYQAVSGAGVKGVRELESQIGALSARADDLASGNTDGLPQATAFPKTIAHNVLSMAGDLVDDETVEEIKFRNESRKILDMPDLDVTCTCVRVPVFTGHSIALDLEFENVLTPEDATAILGQSPGVLLSEMPTPLDAAGGDVSLVGRIRKSGSDPKRLALFVSGDNLRKGAALNAIQIAELLLG